MDAALKTTTDGAEHLSARARRTTLAVLFLLYAVAYIDKKVIALLVDPIRASLGLTDFQVSLAAGSAFVLFYLLFSIPIGWAVDHFSRRWITFLGVVTWSLFATLGGLARNYGQLVVSRFGVGAGEAVLGPAGNSIIADIVPREQMSRAIAVFHCGVLAGSALAYSLGGTILTFAKQSDDIVLPLVGRIEPWQLVLILVGLPGILLAFAAFAMTETRAHSLARASSAANAPSVSALRFMVARWRFYLPHFLGFSLFSVATAGFAGWMPTHMMRTYALPAASLGTTLAAIQLSCGALGMFLPALIIDRRFKAGIHDAPLRIYGWFALLMSGAGVLTGLAPTPTLAFLGIAIVESMVGFLPAAAAALQLTTPSQYRGRVMAAFLIVYNVLGQAMGPAVVGAITDFGFGDSRRVGWSLAVTFAIVGPLAGACLFCGRRAMRRIVAADAAPRSLDSISE
jgi:MFS family permease